MTQKMNTGLKISGDKPPKGPSLMLEEYLQSDAGVIDGLVDGVDVQKIVARYGRVKSEVDALVATISQTPKTTTAQL